MVRGSSEIFKKLKATAVLSAVLLSAIVMSGLPSTPPNANGIPFVGDGIPGDSYADIGRPSFLVAGKYLNYSVRFGLVEGVANQTTNVTANIMYQVNSIAGSNLYVTEQTTNLRASYGFTNPERIMGFYNTGVQNATLLADQYRGYSSLSPVGPIKASVLNSTDLASTRSFTTNLNVSLVTGAFQSASGNGTNQVIVDSMLPTSPGRAYFFGYYRTILSYYKTLGTLYRAPKALYNSAPGFRVDGTATVSTALGTRSAVKLVHDVNRAPPVFNGSYADWKWQDVFYIDAYTGVLIKAVMYVDCKADGLRLHQLEYDLVNTNLAFSTPSPSPVNEFAVALDEIEHYLASSALNDTNRSLFHHAAVGGATVPSNSTKLSADTFKILFGYEPAFGESLQLLFQEAIASRLYDRTSGGMHRSMNAAGTAVDGVKTAADAAWAILGSAVVGESAYAFQKAMLNYMVTRHYSNGTYSGFRFYAFARYNNTADTTFFAYDNLIAYLAMNTLAFYHNETSVKNQAKDIAHKLISLFYSPGGSYPSFWAPNGLFVTSITKNGTIGATSKLSIDSLLAVFSLCQYWAYNQSTATVAHVNRAFEAFNALLVHAWNGTNKGFAHELFYGLNVSDSNQHLEDNAWAMAASVALLEAANKASGTSFPWLGKKNITYYDVACDTWGAIKKVLRDMQNKTFRSASNSGESSSGSLGILAFSLAGMLTISRSTMLVVTTNATTADKFVYENGMPVKATASWKLNFTRDLNVIGLAKINTVIPLNYSDAHFKIRYANSTIYDELFAVTNNDGMASFTFPLPSPPGFSDMDPARMAQSAHLIGVVLNRTGFEVKEGFRAFYVTSIISVWIDPNNPTARFVFSGAKFSAYFNERTTPDNIPSIYPGETFTVSINMTNSVNKSQAVNITFEGEHFNRTSEIKTVNGSVVNATYTLTLSAKGTIPTGMQAINYSISKNGSAISAGEIPVYVNIPVYLTNVRYAAYVVDSSAYNLTFNVKNLNKNRNESVRLDFSSVNLELVSGDTSFSVTDIEPDEEIPYAASFRIKAGAARLNVYQFQITLSWEGVTLATLEYIVPFRAPVELISISGPTNPIQGGPMLYSISLRNNYASSTPVSITIHRVRSTGDPSTVHESTVTLTPGVNNLVISAPDPLDSMWDIGNREYRVVVSTGAVEVGRATIVSDVRMSVENALFGYVMVFGAFGVVFLLIINKKRQLDSVRR